MSEDDIKGILGIGLLAGMAFFAYCGYSKISEWCSKPKELTYTLKSDRAFFESTNGEKEFALSLPSRKTMLECVLECEASGRPLEPSELLAMYERADSDGNKVITPDEAAFYRQTTRR